jgi:hypothetical protein
MKTSERQWFKKFYSKEETSTLKILLKNYEINARLGKNAQAILPFIRAELRKRKNSNRPSRRKSGSQTPSTSIGR